MRKFEEALEATIAAVPPEQSALRKRLDRILADSAYAAPEIRWGRYGALVSMALSEFIEDPYADNWGGTVCAAWRGEPSRAA